MESHPKAEKLRGFLEGEANRSQAREVRLLVTHLLRGCSECVATVEQIVRPERELTPGAYDDAFDRIFGLIQTHPDLPRPLPNLAARRGVLSLPGSPI